MSRWNPLSLRKKWEQKIRVTPGCWLWTGNRLKGTYGMLMGYPERKNYYAHRLSWQFYFGDIPEGLFVCHKCDNPPCVNPDHLFLGTNRENILDCIAKGRNAAPERTRHVGMDNGRAKLTNEDVLAIRESYKSAPRKIRVRRGTLKALATKYGITTVMIRYIVTNHSWKSVESQYGVTITEI